jgi:hypothetical protein
MDYREQEITKQISLNMQFSAAFLLLKTTGKCETDIPEWMFDLDYPGQYMRRIHNVSLTIPCVIGPTRASTAVKIDCTQPLCGSSNAGLRVQRRMVGSQVTARFFGASYLSMWCINAVWIFFIEIKCLKCGLSGELPRDSRIWKLYSRAVHAVIQVDTTDLL